MTSDTFLKNRIWFILTVLAIASAIVPTQFRKGGISSGLLFAIPITVSILGYIYALPLKSIPLKERVLLLLVLCPAIYAVMTAFTYKILDKIFDDFNMEVDKTEAIEFFVNLLYYSLITIPLIALVKIYSLLRARTE